MYLVLAGWHEVKAERYLIIYLKCRGTSRTQRTHTRTQALLTHMLHAFAHTLIYYMPQYVRE
jgi:hypothetical protein